MAGLIKREDIDRVRAAVRIDDVASQYVALRPGGVDSLKGLCPFHDEKTPSFHVRPNLGRWHCFGCGEGGDVFAFVQRAESIDFVEAVELLARRAGIELHYEGARERRPGEPSKRRLIDAHRVAVQFYRAQFDTPAAAPARTLLAERGFERAAVDHFECGYAPDSWDALYTHLRSHGFSDREIETAGLATRGNRGLYDRFRGRLMWPIFSITGEPIGFGARRLGEDDRGPKYLNTPETPIYKKSQVLYGLNLAKKEIATSRSVVIVEGYTDVMAAHLAGITTAVATCGTAFGAEHVKIVRRLLGDGANPAAGVVLSSGKAYGGEVIFTFDGDSAGQKAALRAFGEDQAFATQTYVAIAPDNLDPCDVRLQRGDEALREVIAGRRPLFEFAIRSLIEDLPLTTAEGRSAGLRVSAPIVAGIRDRVLRGEYTRNLAGWLGMDEHVVRQAVAEAGRQGRAQARAVLEAASEHTPRALAAGGAQQAGVAVQPGNAPSYQAAAQRTGTVQGSAADAGTHRAATLPPVSQLRDPTEKVERAALEIYLQLPAFAARAEMDNLPPHTFTHPVHHAIHTAIRAAGGTRVFAERFAQLTGAGMDVEHAEPQASAAYVEAVIAAGGPELAGVISQLAAEPLPETDVQRLPHYVWGIALALIRLGVLRQIEDVRSALQRTNPEDAAYQQHFARLMELEAQRRTCEERMELG
ncbi:MULTISPECIES: DNA primase [Actinotignum]|uniref:DNA primase n=3 Tax=Actinomycetaceae TaxID=2049 RepID=A0AAW9HLU2_9ACTO|nr:MULTISPECIES: DNA primase [Actinotignum]MDK8534504.1 DNA primase [Gleimia europaea]MDE1558239.1 DNA primase [Actinotignum schaalii]MDE1663064.1 DNA primase [Actinotignum schaalii]MDK6373089.1 DNA primase [Actinotignum timonense]MDK6419437.1 DNA primase [Actinotignum timonense]